MHILGEAIVSLDENTKYSMLLLSKELAERRLERNLSDEEAKRERNTIADIETQLEKIREKMRAKRKVLLGETQVSA